MSGTRFSLFVSRLSMLIGLFVCQETTTSTNHAANIISNQVAPYPFNHSPFTAYWNVPTYNCSHLFNVSLELDKYDIRANKGENFTGDEVVIFYDDEFGYYPFYRGNVTFNGGLPQLADLHAHLEKATDDVLAKIPDPAFKGIAILDWESWRPQWAQNFDTREVYREQSIRLVGDKHPGWSNDTVELVAILEFEQAARSFMESSLRLVTELRPEAQWGFYHFPYCYNGKKLGRECSSEAVASNDNITWLFDASTALYPSIYLPGSQGETTKFVEGVTSEALRVRKESKNPRMDIYMYTRYVYARSALFLTKEDLNHTILRPAEMGASGVVFWGSQEDYHTNESCIHLQSYIKQFLGPFVKNVTDAASVCSDLLCSGNGRCTGDIMGCAATLVKVSRGHQENSLWTGVHDWREDHLFPCVCDCFEGWNGASCSQQS